MDLDNILTEHRRVWELQTSIGLIKLKHLSRIDSAWAMDRITEMDPEFLKACSVVSHYKRISAVPGGNELCEDAKRQLKRAQESIYKYAHWFSIKCFVDPLLHDPEQLSALADAMTKEDWDKLSTMLTILTSPRPVSESTKALIKLSKDWNLPLSKDLTLETMTVSQASVLEAIHMEEVEAIKKAFNGGETNGH